MSSSTTHPYLPGADRVPDHHQHHQQQQQMLFQQQNLNQHGSTQFYHVPQHSRREKLRYLQNDDSNSLPVASLYSPHFLTQPPPGVLSAEALPMHYQQIGGASQTGFSLSLSSSSSGKRQLGSGVPGPYGPFTGYAAVLGRSRFLGPARMLLDEICDVGRRELAQDMDTGSGDDGGTMELDPSERESLSVVDRGVESSREGGEFHWKKTRLLSLMEEVCKRYKQYYQQVQAVITSFESVAGLSNTAPLASVALKSMSKHFKCLKSMILNQLRNANKMNGKEAVNREEIPSFGLLSGRASGGSQRGNNIGTLGQQHQPHIWRPQRGLPERAVSVLRAWLFEHFLHPYPTDTDKQMLAKQTGLTRNQVSNWFINARVRLWKPMVEEIHNLEMCQMRRHSGNDKIPHQNPGGMPSTQQMSECSGSNPSELVQGQSSHTNPRSGNPNLTSRNVQPGELSEIPNSIPEQINFGYNSLGTVGFSAGSSNPSGVSLTLGLQQNNRVCLPESIPANLVHRFGLEDCNDPYVMGSFEAQGRHFGKDVSGHLLHDFVG